MHRTRKYRCSLPVVLIREHFVATTDQFSAYGCLNDDVTLSCGDNRTIYVVSAVYGQWAHSCSDGCCPPHPVTDCRQDVEETRESDWLALKVTCDNKTTCDYQYLAAIINDCLVDYTADYMRVFYTCLPGTLIATIFTINLTPFNTGIVYPCKKSACSRTCTNTCALLKGQKFYVALIFNKIILSHSFSALFQRMSRRFQLSLPDHQPIRHDHRVNSYSLK